MNILWKWVYYCYFLSNYFCVMLCEFLLACVVFVQYALRSFYFIFHFMFIFYLCFKIRLFFFLHIIEVVTMLCSWEMATFSSTLIVSRRRICNPIRTIRFVVQKLNEFILCVVETELILVFLISCRLMLLTVFRFLFLPWNFYE